MNIGRTSGESIQRAITQDALEKNKSKLAAQAETPDMAGSEATATGDTVDISEEARNKAEDFQKMLDEMRNEMKALREGLKRASEAGDGIAEAWKERIKCLQIAMRIMCGDIVPEADHRYLRERDIELYSRAIQLRIEKEDPKEYDRLSENEENRRDKAKGGSEDAAPASSLAQYTGAVSQSPGAVTPPVEG